jgi:acyl-CoA synthetase (AMP-forming)/AMP-acid ligase II
VQRYLNLCTLGDLLLRGATHHRDRDALVVDEQRLTYGELEQRARGVARSLTAMGVGHGDRIGMFLPNSAAFIEILFGILLTGGIAVPVNARFKSAELAHIIPDADLRVLFVGDAATEPQSRLGVVADALHASDMLGPEDPAEPAGLYRLRTQRAPALEAIVAAGTGGKGPPIGGGAFAELAESVPDGDVDHRRARVALRDPAMMFYTSGTTAMPKGCTLTHEALMRTGVTTAGRLGYRDGDRVFAPCPMFHTASTQPMIATLHATGTMVTMGHFEPAAALKLIHAEGVSALFTAFPPLTEGLLGHPDYTRESFAGVRTVFTVAPAEALRSMQARMPASVMVNAYGMTEFGGSVVMVSPDEGDEARLATQGLPLPGIEIDIRSPDNFPVPVGERGEIVVRGPSMFTGYHNDPGNTAACIEQDGWFHTGDLGSVEPDGRLKFLGRLKDMLKVGGENVAALEIAAHLQGHPAVAIAHVVGLADERYGEVPAAFVELYPGAALTEQEAIAHCRDALAGFKVPRYVRFVTNWPMSSTKVQTARLREKLEAELRGDA